MKKRLLCLFITFLLLSTTKVFATEKYNEMLLTKYEYLEDGSYFVITFEEIIDSDVSVLSTVNTKKGAKTYTYYNNEGKNLWYVKVIGTFSYGNNSSKCTNSTVIAKANDSAWKIYSKSASKSKNVATATVIAKQYSGSLLLNTINKSVSLTCSSTGKLS